MVWAKRWNFITGNMDSDDEQEIRSYLTNLTTISNANTNDWETLHA